MFTTILFRTIHYLNFNIIFLKNSKNALFLISLSICFMINAVLSQGNVQLPSRWKTDSMCRHLTSRQDNCTGDETLSWEYQPGTTIHDNYTSSRKNAIECHKTCLEDSRCLMITYEYTYNTNCYLQNIYKSSRQYPHYQYELALLSCCKKVPMKYKTDIILDKTASQELCQPIEKKSYRTCLEPVYVKHSDIDSRYADVKRYVDVTLEDCMKFCNEEPSCIAFNFRNSQCVLKHTVREFHSMGSIDLYILSCCPEVSDFHCPSCPPKSDRTDACKSPKSAVWSINTNYKLSGTILQTHNVSLFQCPNLCLANPSCVGISFKNADQQCDLLGSIGEPQSDTDSEYGILKCIETDHVLIKSKRVRPQSECGDNRCHPILNRRSTCNDAIWMKVEENDANLFTIQKLDHLNFDDCFNLCNDFHSCLIFTYSVERNECQLKYKIGSFVSKQNTTLYIVKCLHAI